MMHGSNPTPTPAARRRQIRHDARRPDGRGGPMAMMKGEKPRDFKGTMRKLIEYLGQYKACHPGRMALRHRLDRVLHRRPQDPGQGHHQAVRRRDGQDRRHRRDRLRLHRPHHPVDARLLYLVSAVFSYIQGWIMSGVSMKITYRFRKDIAEKINRMPLRVL